MYQFILLINAFSCIGIIGLVLIQQGKGATMGAAFGSGASQTVFGSRGSGSFLFRLTMTLAAVFFITSISLSYMVTRAYKQERVVTLPAMPAPAPANAVQQPAPVSTSTVPAIPVNTHSDTTKK